MKKTFKAFEPITNEELNEIAGGSSRLPATPPQFPFTQISITICRTTQDCYTGRCN